MSRASSTSSELHHHGEHQGPSCPTNNQRAHLRSQHQQQQQRYHHQQREMGNSMSSNVTQTSSETAHNDKLDIQDIRDLGEVDKLAVKQLKIILTRNCVDFRGVIEKEVLKERVVELWIEFNRRKYKQNPHSYNRDGTQPASDDIDDNQACKICMEREINCVFLECGHMLTCVTCGRKLAECPICRQNIVRCVRTFKG